MKKIFCFFLAVTLSVLAFTSCDNRDKCTVNGTILGVDKGQVVLSCNVNDQFTPIDTVEMLGGKFHAVLPFTSVSMGAVEVIPEGKESASLSFFIEPATVTIEADWKDVNEDYQFFTESTVTGGKNAELSEKFSKVYQSVLSKPEYAEYKKLRDRLNEAQKNADSEAYRAASEEMHDPKYDAVNESIQKDVDKAARDLILQNPDVEYSVIYMRYIAGNTPLDELESLFNSLSPRVQACDFATEIKEEIAAQKLVQPGSVAPDFTLSDPNGAKISLSDFRGKYVIIDFWASWCGPCRAAFPAMKEIYAKYHSKGLEILGVSDDSKYDEWVKALKEEKTPWKHVCDEFPYENKPARVGTLYAVHYIPSMFLINPQGIIVGKFEHDALIQKLEEIF